MERHLYLAEATGVGPAWSTTVWRMRVLVPDFRPLPAFTPRWSTGSRRDAPAHGRYRQRARMLTPVQEASIQSLAATKSLRSLAAEFGVSHETVRRVIRDADATVA